MTPNSPRQTRATKPLYDFQDYTTATGQPALSVQISVRDIAKFYAAHPHLVNGGVEHNWATINGSEHVNRRIEDIDDALDALERFEFPARLKADANRAARTLTHVFEQIARLTILHDLTAGRIDRRKFADIARTTAAGTFDVNMVRPYRRTQPAPITPPTLAIIASAGAAEMWADPTYIPRVVTLALSVQWACEAAGLLAYMALVRTHCRLDDAQPYREAIEAFMFATPDQTISPKTFGVALHRDLWRRGIIASAAADYESFTRLTALQGERPDPKLCGGSFPSRNGGHASRWAREVLRADVVIGIGHITDTPDIHLNARFSLDEAVTQIAHQARLVHGQHVFNPSLHTGGLQTT